MTGTVLERHEDEGEDPTAVLGAEIDAGGRRNGRVHRPVDLLLAVVALGALVLLLAAIDGLPAGSTELASDAARALRHVPQWVAIGTSVVAFLGSLVLALLALHTLLRRDGRDALAAGLGATAGALASFVSSFVWSGDHAQLDRVLLHGGNPAVLAYDCAFVAFLTASDLVRRGRWTRWCVLVAAALFLGNVGSSAVAALGFPVCLLTGLLCGWFVRWSIGAAATRPSADELAAWLVAADVRVRELRETDGPRKGMLEGALTDGTAIEVRIADLDSRGAGVARRLWALLRMRPAVAGHLAFGSRSRLERISLTSFLAERRGAIVPRVLAMRELDDDTYVLVTTRPQGRHPSNGEDAEEIGKLFSALKLLHEAGVAHRNLRPENLVLADGTAGFSSLEAAQPGASDLLRRLDITQLLTTASRCSTPDIAVQALREAYQPTDEAAIASVLQPLALAPWGWTEIRAARGCVAEISKELGGATDAERRRTSLERFRWRTVLTASALVAAAFVLIGQLSKVNLGGALRHANPGWCAVAVLGSAITYFAAAENLAAFVPKRLSVLRGFGVQLSTAFVGVAMPPTVGHVAVNSRYLRRQGVEDGAIAAAVALSQVVNVLVTVLLLLVIGTLTGSGVSRLKIAPSSTLLVALGGVVALVGVLLVVPPTRTFVTRNIWPRLRSVWPRLLQALSNPLRLAMGAGANLLLTASYALAFIASIRAVGGSPAILPAAAVFLAGNAVGSAAPTPGGVGAVEAVLAAGLSALGIPVHEAIPAVLIFRLATFWLPIPAGWASYTVLGRRGVL